MAFKDPRKYQDPFMMKIIDMTVNMFGLDLKHEQYNITDMFYGDLAHEIVHQFQSPDLDSCWGEFATRFYEDELVNQLNLGNTHDENEKEMVNFYKGVINNHGDNVHRIFFGDKSLTPQIKQNILGEMDQSLIDKYSFYF
jgi:hypothetical protein